MYRPKIIVILGPSGVGKGTIEKNLFKDEKLKLKFSISATTRSKREDEINGVQYFFKNEKEFLELIEKNEFIEWNKHLNNYYGTLKHNVDDIIKEGMNVLIEVETSGALNILKYYKERNLSKEVISIFILPPNFEELEKRILKRGSESEEQIKKRLEKAKKEIDLKNEFKYVVVNDSLEKCVEKIKLIIKKETNEI